MITGNAIDSDTVVLIVENEKADTDMLIDICRTVGFAIRNILHVWKLEDAKGHLNRGDVDLVLLDLAVDDPLDPLPAVWLLERWGNETGRKAIPVIVVSGFTAAVKPAALAASNALLIPKPGETDGERTLFSGYLDLAIRTAISRRSKAATFRDRIRQQSDRILSRIGLGSPHIHMGGPVSWQVQNPVLRVLIAIVVLGCWAVTLYTFAETHGWPVKILMWPLIGLLLIVVSWAIIPRRRSR